MQIDSLRLKPINVYLPISKLHSILAAPNLLAHNNISISYNIDANRFATAKTECSFEIGK